MNGMCRIVYNENEVEKIQIYVSLLLRCSFVCPTFWVKAVNSLNDKMLKLFFNYFEVEHYLNILFWAVGLQHFGILSIFRGK